MMYAIAVYCVVWCASLWWARHCVSETSDHMEALIDAIDKVPDVNQKIHLIDLLDVRGLYNKHMLRLMTFRDPWVIYPPELSSLMRVQV